MLPCSLSNSGRASVESRKRAHARLTASGVFQWVEPRCYRTGGHSGTGFSQREANAWGKATSTALSAMAERQALSMNQETPWLEPWGVSVRETYEETGLQVEVRRFLAAVAYRLGGDSVEKLPVFYTFAFLLDEVGGALGVLDESERVEAFFEVEPGSLLSVAERLEQVETTYSEEIGGRWRDWGCFRAVIHRVVWEVFAGKGKA